MLGFHTGDQLSFDYTNYRGETSVRHVIFIGLDYGENKWYPEPQWFMRTWDCEKQAYRSFALNKIDVRKMELL